MYIQTSYIALDCIQIYCGDVVCFEKQLCFLSSLALKSISNHPSACAGCIGHSYFKHTYVHIIDASFDGDPFWIPTLIQEQDKFISKKKHPNKFFSSLSLCVIRTFFLHNYWLFFLQFLLSACWLVFVVSSNTDYFWYMLLCSFLSSKYVQHERHMKGCF